MKLQAQFYTLRNQETLEVVDVKTPFKSGFPPKTVLLVHGYAHSWHLFEPLIEDLMGIPSLRIIVPTLRLHGESSRIAIPEYFGDLAQDLKHLMDHKLINIRKFDLLVAFSMGGAIAQSFAADFPESVVEMILLSTVSYKGYVPFVVEDVIRRPQTKPPSLRVREPKDLINYCTVGMFKELADKQNRKGIVDATKLVFKKQPTQRELNQWVDDMFRNKEYLEVSFLLAKFNISSETNFNGFPGNGKANSIRCPVTFLYGDVDPLKPDIQETIQFYRARNIPVVEKEVPACAHYIWADAYEEVVKAVLNALTKPKL